MDTLKPAADQWLASPTHLHWLREQGQRLLEFAKGARVPDGFAALDGKGHISAGSPAETIHTARMVHSFALAHLQGIPGSAPMVDHGLRALEGPLRDAVHGGWFATAGGGQSGERKQAYLHAFVALAASSAAVAQRPGAVALLDDAVAVLQTHFWNESEQAFVESFAADWSDLEAYRGGNSNMHGVEACLALADVCNDNVWLDRALAISTRMIHQQAAQAGYLPVEHFDADWNPLADYNQDKPADEFRPFGQTPGHAFEWARLLLHLEAARHRIGMPNPAWLADDARALFAAATRWGWAVDGQPGIVYTLDWEHRPVVHARLHWTLAEAAAAAAALLRRTGEPEYEEWYRRFWDYIDCHLIDRQHGSWHHELDTANRPARTIWPGKPDLYHAYQATLLPGLALAPSLATALARR
jgi:mannose/cellobiose epimerase-like protein (N-acyl-D-glucosamine 2-epimerase family)